MPSNKFTILLKGGETREENIAAAGTAIKPGHLIDFNGTTVNQVILAAADIQGSRVAIEDSGQGKAIADAYSPGDVVFSAELEVGDVALVRAAAATYTQGQRLKRVGSGRVGAIAAATDKVLFVAEPLDSNDQPVLSQVCAADDLIRVRRV